jgi:4-amino-4-deoxy-L-arabinose transferase-like glycosyltransferase
MTAPRGFARLATWALILGAFAVMLAQNLPGHLTYDSIAQLHEGRFAVRETWGPAFYARLLAVFDAIVPGTALYVVFSGLLFFGALAALPLLRRRATWLAPIAVALLATTPQVIIYQGIVWKDVLFADASVAALVCLALGARDSAAGWTRAGWFLLAMVLLAVGAQARQNGLVVAVFGAIAAGWLVVRWRGWRLGAGAGIGFLAGVFLVSHLIGVLSLGSLKRNPGVDADTGVAFGVRLLESYDVVAAQVLEPGYHLAVFEHAQPAAAALIRARGPAVYTPSRVDFLAGDPTIGSAFVALPQPLVDAQWIDLVTHHPGLYLKVRWRDFRSVVSTPVIDWCLPIDVGVQAPDKLMADLRMSNRWSDTDQRLQNYASWWFDTPAYRHHSWLAVSLVLSLFLLWRREPTDIPLLALQLASLAFAATFFVISIACDYRYLYFCDIAAMAGVVYVALDPAGPRGRAAR